MIVMFDLMSPQVKEMLSCVFQGSELRAWSERPQISFSSARHRFFSSSSSQVQSTSSGRRVTDPLVKPIVNSLHIHKYPKQNWWWIMNSQVREFSSVQSKGVGTQIKKKKKKSMSLENKEVKVTQSSQWR